MMRLYSNNASTINKQDIGMLATTDDVYSECLFLRVGMREVESESDQLFQ